MLKEMLVITKVLLNYLELSIIGIRATLYTCNLFKLYKIKTLNSTDKR